MRRKLTIIHRWDKDLAHTRSRWVTILQKKGEILEKKQNQWQNHILIFIYCHSSIGTSLVNNFSTGEIVVTCTFWNDDNRMGNISHRGNRSPSWWATAMHNYEIGFRKTIVDLYISSCFSNTFEIKIITYLLGAKIVDGVKYCHLFGLNDVSIQ